MHTGLTATEVAALVALGVNIEREMLRVAARNLATCATIIRVVLPESDIADDLDALSCECDTAADHDDGAGEPRHLRLVT